MSRFDIFLIIGTFVIPVYEFSEKIDFRVGKMTRSPGGNLQSDARAEKLSWTGRTLLSRADYQTLKGIIANDTRVAVSGSALASGGPITCIVRMDDTPYEHDEGSLYAYAMNPNLSIYQV